MKIKMLCLILVMVFAVSGPVNAFWLWTKETGKIINPKFAVKDTPREQYDWAMSFYNEGDYKRAVEEFSSLLDHYEDSEVASEAQYYLAVSYQKAGKYFIAFKNFQKLIKEYPFSSRIDDVIIAEYKLGELYYNRSRGTLLGMDLMTDVEKAIEIFSTIIEDLPYSAYADNAQFMIAMCYEKMGQFNKAIQNFQKLVQEYPTSGLVEKAKYEIAQAMYAVSKKADYDQEPTDEAIVEFEKYSAQVKDKELKEKAKNTIKHLRERKAENIYKSAKFYEKRKKYKSADIYYREILDKYADTSFSPMARKQVETIRPLLNGG